MRIAEMHTTFGLTLFSLRVCIILVLNVARTNSRVYLCDTGTGVKKNVKNVLECDT